MGPGTEWQGSGSCRSQLCSSVNRDGAETLLSTMISVQGCLAKKHTLLCLRLALGEEARDTTPFAAQGHPVHNLKAPTRSRMKETLQIGIANKVESLYGAARRG